MTSKVYIGDGNGSARKVVDAFVGINGIAHRIAKIYVGDGNGLARLAYDFELSDGDVWVVDALDKLMITSKSMRIVDIANKLITNRRASISEATDKLTFKS